MGAPAPRDHDLAEDAGIEMNDNIVLLHGRPLGLGVPATLSPIAGSE